MPYYMKLADAQGLLAVRGDVKAKGYEGWVSLTSAQVNATRGVATTGQGSGSDRGPSTQSVTVTKDTDGTSSRLFHLGSVPSAPPMTCTIVFIAECATSPYMTVEILSASIGMNSGSPVGDQFDIVGYLRVLQKSAPPPPRRDTWHDFSRSFG